jgi:hypothetical protein
MEQSEARSPIKRMVGIGAFWLAIAIGLPLINFFLGLQMEMGTIDLVRAFTSHEFSNYRYSIGESLLDFDKFWGEFWGSLIFAGLIGGGLVIYGDRGSMTPNNAVRLKRWQITLMILFIMWLALILFIILGTFAGIGLARPYMSNNPWELLRQNFFPEHIAEQLIPFALWGSGMGILLYRAGKSTRTEVWIPQILGVPWIFTAVAGIQLLLLIFPLDKNNLFTSNTLLELVYSTCQLFGTIGLALIIESIMEDKHFLTHTLPHKGDSRLIRHLLVYCRTFLSVLGIIGFLVATNNPYFEIGIFRLFQSVFTGIFRILSALLIWSGMMYRKLREVAKC